MFESEGFSHFKFMYQRFLTSTVGWKEAEQGAYLRLLIVQFDQGGIPADLAAIGEISPVAKKIWAKKLARKFRHTNPDGTLYNSVMKAVRDDAIEKHAVNKENGAKGGQAKKANAIANGTANAKPSLQRTDKRNASQPVTSNQEPKEEKNKKEGWNSFPGPDITEELSEMEVGASIEWIHRLKKVLLSSDRINDFWYAFRLNLTGTRFYARRSDLLQHFRNWLKDQNLDVKFSISGNSTQKSVIENRTEDILSRFE